MKVAWRTFIETPSEPRREGEWRRLGVPECDIVFSRLSGISARDVQVFREVSNKGFLIVVRCPKASARTWHGQLAPKPMSIKEKTSPLGVVIKKGRMYVSDYDLMGVWRCNTKGFQKVFMSAKGTERGRWSPEAQALALELNRRLASPIQHGCQDDFYSSSNPGVKPADHFAVFHLGSAQHLADALACAQFYATNGLFWPYSAEGKFVG